MREDALAHLRARRRSLGVSEQRRTPRVVDDVLSADAHCACVGDVSEVRKCRGREPWMIKQPGCRRAGASEVSLGRKRGCDWQMRRRYLEKVECGSGDFGFGQGRGADLPGCQQRGADRGATQSQQPAPSSPQPAHSAARSLHLSPRGLRTTQHAALRPKHPPPSVCISLSPAAGHTPTGSDSASAIHCYTTFPASFACLPCSCWLCEPARSDACLPREFLLPAHFIP